MSENADLHETGEKRRSDSPATDATSSESKRPRLQDEFKFVASSNAMQETAEVTSDSPMVPEVPMMEVEREATASSSTGKVERPKKAPWARRDLRSKNREAAASAGEGDEEGPKAVRYPKRMCTVLMGFCGSGYSGMQMCVGFSLISLIMRAKCSISQPDHIKTIEGVLFKALVKVGAVSQDNADNPSKVRRVANAELYIFNLVCVRSALARAARTDAGVHAAGNVVSLKMIITIPGVSDLVARINEELPPEIRIWGYVSFYLVS